ncbi:MAG: ATP-binding protein [Bacteroidota bacterium]
MLTTLHLSSVPALANVPSDQLEWLITVGSEQNYAAGDYLFRRGDDIDKMFIVLDGRFDIRLQQGNDFKIIDRLGPGTVSGYLPYSRATTATGFGIFTASGKALIIPQSKMKEMCLTHHELTTALVHVMTSRTREFTKANSQSEKLMALGKLSAGLAHELNNPSAAMVSSARELKRQLGAVPEKFKRLVSMQATPAEVDAINQILFAKLEPGQSSNLSMIERSKREEGLEEWLEEHGVDEAYQITETLVDFGFVESDLTVIYEAARQANFPSAIEWVENVLVTEKIVGEIIEAADRISGIVSAVKGYTHMDRAKESEPMDIRRHLENTLTILQHKLKRKSATTSLHVPDNLPQPCVIIGEINQVFTNVIDNAIDAVEEESGQIIISAISDGSTVSVIIADNGTGIPPEYLGKIFDPFFTTKELGQGTGLGLDVSHRIITQHKGSINVDSDTSGTRFTIIIPLSTDSND